MILESLQLVQDLIDDYRINLTKCVFISFTVLIVLLGMLINKMESRLPGFLSQSFRYGKCSYKGVQDAFVSKLEVPKSWFSHFYVFAFAWSILGLTLFLKGLIEGSQAPEFVIKFLDLVAGGRHREVLVNSTSGLFAILFMTMQCVRRFYETNFVQIFSSKSKMNLSHYLVGYIHYFGVIVTILANTEGFVRGTSPSPIALSKNTLTQYMCCALFYFCWSEQYKTNMILVNLRKDATGKKTTEKHLLPRGGHFENISSPHMLFEIGMYVAITGIISDCTTWLCILVWVVSNQTENAWLVHKWYKENFKDYPKKRYAIFPLIL